MSKRKCGTCRFFQDGGLASSGWCHHPVRRGSRDALLMVRKGELACRNGWNDDLWAEATDGEVAPAAEVPDRFPVRRVPPASPEEIAAVMMMRAPEPDDAPPRAQPPEDVLVGQATVLPDVDDDDRARVLAQNTREAIRQARARHLAKAAPRPVDADVPPDAFDAPRPLRSEPTRPPERARVEATPPPRAPTADPAERQRPVTADRRDQEHGTFGMDRGASSTVSDHPLRSPSPNAGSLPEPAARPVRATAEVGATQPPAALSSVAGRSRRIVDDPPPAVVDRRSPTADASRRAASASPERLIERGRRPDVPMPDYGNAWQARTWRERDRAERAEPVEPIETPPPLDVPAPPALDEPPVPIVAEARPTPPIAEIAGYAALDIEFDDDEADAPRLDMTIRVAPTVPRMCRTCRDFRPADSGDRGWCTSKWAFSHRRMVNADDLTCDSSLGCWWLPHDDVWLSTIDISAHGQPTPLLDSRLQLPDAAGGGPGRR